MARAVCIGVVPLMLVIACGDNDGSTQDVGSASMFCTVDDDCDDGLFCTGIERCDPSDTASDEQGCVVDSPVCLTSQVCDEASDACRTLCGETTDADGDGHDAMVCGGDDCDDADSDRYPGHAEVCDADGIDEDCDPSTVAGSDGDMDGDGVIAFTCCNGSRCGDDCDDSAASVAPGAAEICNGVDEDCDGLIDEGVFEVVYTDADGDGFGDPSRSHELPCIDDSAFVADSSDCDDQNAAVHPGADELCDGRDTDCDGTQEIDRDGDGHYAPEAMCAGGPLARDDCDDALASTHGQALELCNGLDDDCDGTRDEREDTDARCTASLDNGVGICTGGACVLSDCARGFENCDTDLRNGCETQVASDETNCGACGIACPLASECVDGMCVVATKPIGITLGMDHACSLLEGGNVACWGDSSAGQIGDGVFGGPRRRPSMMLNISDAVDIAASRSETCVVRRSGEVFCTGGSNLGRDDINGTAIPVAAVGIDDALQTRGAICAGERHFCVIRSGGAVWCWGRGWGVGTGVREPNVELPIASLLEANATQLACGRDYTCARMENGTVECFGNGPSGELGDGVAGAGGPVSVLDADTGTPLAGVSRVESAGNHNCAITDSGIRCWGANEYGQAPTTDLVPCQVGTILSTCSLRAAPLNLGAYTLPQPIDIAVADGGTCIVHVGNLVRGGVCQGSGCVVCFGAPTLVGAGSSSSLGDVLFLHDAVEIMGGYTGVESGVPTVFLPGYFCARTARGDISCWGNASSPSSSGRLGDGLAESSLYPASVRGILPPSQLRGQSCASRADGTLLCAGDNDTFQLGYATRSAFAYRRAAVSNVVDFDQSRHTCAVHLDGTVSCWGANEAGQLGDGVADHGHNCSQVRGQVLDCSPDPVEVLELTEPARLVATGDHHSCTVDDSESVHCWGGNEHGQLGDGSTEPRETPSWVAAAGPTIQLAAGFAFTCARDAAGVVRCWGSDAAGQLGDGTNAVAPGEVTVVDGLSDAIDVAAGYLHACAVRGTGDVLCWGANTQGQLGDGRAGHGTCPPPAAGDCSLSPVRVVGLRNAVEVGAGFHHSCARIETGEIFCWGDNSEGQLGDETNDFSSRPRVAVHGVLNARSLTVGNRHACAITVGGETLCWGSNDDGELGIADQFINASTRAIPPRGL